MISNPLGNLKQEVVVLAIFSVLYPMFNPLQSDQIQFEDIGDRCQRSLISRWSTAKQLRPAGFTLLEAVTVVAIVGILFALAVPGWASFITLQRLNGGQEQVLLAMREAQSHAKHSHVIWQASFQNANGVVQWAVHPASITPMPSLWSSLDSAIQMDAETTLQQSGEVRRVQFDHEGNVNGQLGRLTLSSKMGGKMKRCVVVSTLLGAVRTGKEHTTLQDGKYCY